MLAAKSNNPPELMEEALRIHKTNDFLGHSNQGGMHMNTDAGMCYYSLFTGEDRNPKCLSAFPIVTKQKYTVMLKVDPNSI